MSARIPGESAIPSRLARWTKGWALWESLREGYTRASFLRDLLAGATVMIIALPLSMALAIASGVPPQYGLYTAIVAGAVIALLGGSRVAVSGPTAAFVVILAPVAAKYGLGGLMVSSLMAGFILVIMGMASLGKLIQFIPYPVTSGFTAGIAITLATLQVKDFFGLNIAAFPDHYIGRVQTIISHLGSLHWPDALTGAVSLATLLLWPKLTRKIPAPLIASLVGAIFAFILSRSGDGFSADTIGSRFSFLLPNGSTGHGVPQAPPAFRFPWMGPDASGAPIGLNIDLLSKLAGSAVAIAMLGAIESLLCAVVSDAMVGTRHDPDRELIGQGIGNIVASFFGGFAATGAIARTTANIRAGGRTPIAAFLHSIFLVTAILILAPLLSYLPMSTLAALLMIVAWNMSDAKHFIHICKVAPKSDVVVLLTCFSLTVIFDMVIAVTVGVVLAALLFMRRMAALTETRIFKEEHTLKSISMPENVFVYEIAGPLFFGAAERAMAALGEFNRGDRPSAIIVQMHGVPVMDVTGLVALESVIERAKKTKTLIILSGVQEQPMALLTKGGVRSEPGKVAFCFDLEQAAMLASLMGSTDGIAKMGPH